LYNVLINHRENINNVDIIFTSFCCGYGKMTEEESINQIIKGFQDYHKYNPRIIINNESLTLIHRNYVFALYTNRPLLLSIKMI